MATGIVRGLIGSVSVTSREGITRELRISDTVEMNDTVQAASGSTVHIAFDNGNFATVGSNEKLVLDASVIDPMAGSDNKTATDQNVADIQAMIAAGADPTEIAEATAAGGDSGTRGDPDHSGSHSFVVVDQAAARGEVTPGFETGTFSSPVPETENDDGRIDTFLADHDTDANPDSPDVLSPAPDIPSPTPDIPPSNSNPVITDEGQGLLVKESGVGTTDQGGKPGWAIGDHNHAIAGKPVDEGSFKVTDADGDTLTTTLLDKNGVPVKGVVTDDSGTMTVQTEYSTLTVTPTEGADGSVTYTYHYELDNTLADSLNEGDDPVQEHFQIEVSDGHGGTVTQPVDITIEGTNDAPTFNGHGQNIQLKEEGVYNGNHETTDDHKDNGFVFEQNDRPKVQGDLSTYVTDADKGADLTYTVDHFNVKNSAADSVETTLYTANNTAVIDETTGKPVQITVEMVGTPTIDASGIQTIHTNYGTLTVDTKTGHYTFELGGSEEADKLVNSMAAGEKFTFQFETLVTDQFGAIGKHVLSVVIEGANDIPTLTVDKLVLDVTEQGENVSPEYAGTDSGHAQGTDIDRGAELHYSLIDENGRETTIIKTDYGTLTIDADGKYHFTIDNTSDAVKALGEGDTRSAGPFTIRVTDEHGAYTEQEIEVTVHGAKAAPVISDHLVVNEHGLDNASDASETAAIKAPDGYRIIDAENGQHGTVSQDADGNWHYTLSGAIDSGNHPGTNTVTGADTVNMTVEDANGNRFTIDVKVDIVDDVPVIDLGGHDYQNIHVDSGSTIHEATGSIHYDFGADDGQGKSLTVSIGERTVDASGILENGSQTIQGEFGKLTINADGSYSYQANPNIHGGAQDSFVITITDADGDTKDVKLDIDVTPSGITAGNASAIVSEHDIAGNDHANTGSDALHGQDNVPGNPAVDESVFSGHLDLDYGVNGAAHDDAFVWNIPSGNGVQAMIDGSWQSVTWSVNGTTLTGTAGGETVFTLTIDPATGDYQAALNAALQHNAPDGTDMSDSNVDFSGQTDASSGLYFGYTITDASGNTAKGGLDVDVQDDIPVFSQSSDSVTVTDHHYYTDNSELKFSADNIGEGNHSVSFGDNLSISAGTVHYGNDGNISTIDSSDGTLYYKNPADSKFAGLGVQDTVIDDALMNGQDYNGKGRFPEINYSQGDNSSEAIVIDLNGKIAYGMNIDLSNFFGGKGEGAEKALFTFYLNGEIVDVKELTSAQNSGLVNGTFNSVTAGFDKVVISAIDNGISQGPLKDNSDFSISSIQFITASGQPLVTAEGHVEATSADGIKSYDFGDMAFEMADGEKISLTHTTTSNGDIITGTLADGTVVLQGFLSDNGTWSLHQYVSGIHNVGSNNLTIDFVATDNDGDRTTHDTVIPATPDIAHVEVNEHGLDNVADTLVDPGMASSQNDLLIGGTGHDILVGQGGNDLLIGDGDNSLTHDGSLDHLHDLLRTHAQGDDLAAGIHHLFDHGTAQEIHDFTHGIENLNVENSHDGNDHLYGGTGDDILIGMGGNDHLYGGEGHDILLGGSGNDVLVGGKGDDILSGGTGNDIFKYMTGDLDGVTHGDTITDFHLGNLNESNGQLDANADVLDISELISGHDKPTSLESLVNGGYLSFDDVSENADGTLTVKLSIDVDGKDGDAHMTNLATITMTGFEHHAGTDIVQDLMDQLVHNQNIKF